MFGEVVRQAGNGTRIRGYAINVSNYNPFKAEVPEPYTEYSNSADESSYATSLSPFLEAEGLPTRFIIDQGRVALPGAREEWYVAPPFPTRFPDHQPANFEPPLHFLFVVLSRKMLTIPGVNGATWLLLASVSSPVPLSITLSSTALSGSSLAVRVTASAACRMRQGLASGLRSMRRCWWRTRTQASPSDLAIQERHRQEI